MKNAGEESDREKEHRKEEVTEVKEGSRRKKMTEVKEERRGE